MLLRIAQLACKLIQRQTYSCLSRHYGIWFMFCGLVIIIVSAFHFGEVWLQWSASHYAGNFQFSRHYDNIVGKSFQSRLCLPQPIDIVYTWVNGSDPNLIMQLNLIKKKLRDELNSSSTDENTKTRKTINSKRFKWKSKTVCPLPNCVPAYKLALSGVPLDISKTDLSTIHFNFTLAKSINALDDDKILLVSFDSQEMIRNLIKFPLKFKSVTLNSSEVYYTSTIKSGHRKLLSTLMFYNLNKNSTVDEVQSEIEQQLPNSIANIQLYYTESIGVISFVNQEYSLKLKAMSSKRNFTINKRIAKVLPVTYVWYPIGTYIDDEEDGAGSNRFADNNELKYSLRSVEKFAPWVRRIYIVTNGQIPNWLNLNHPRIKVVTHDEIFTNKSHLPTFSSPAIESHIHRIAGLSKRFIYMNDDVFFGLPVWPDDFYTHSKGHKIFLSWAVPNCNEGCPSSWVNDKYCDKACNVSACEWDGGDCLGVTAANKWSLQGRYNAHTKTSGENCHPGCGHNWVGDRYCDANCNNIGCGFDGGDCGTHNLNQLYSYSLEDNAKGNKSHISAPKGTLSMFINLTNTFRSVIEGNYQESKILRTAVISRKYKLLSLTFFKNVSESTLSFQVLGYKGVNKTGKSVVVFKLNISTIQKKERIVLHANKTVTKKPLVKKQPVRLYNHTLLHRRITKLKREVISSFPADLLNLSLPLELADKLKTYKRAYGDGEITQYGYNKSLQLLYTKYLNSVKKASIGRKLLWIHNKKDRQFQKQKNDELTVQKHLSDFHTTFFSFLPWEKTSFLTSYFDTLKKGVIKQRYKTKALPRRHLMDAFSSSLLHVSRLYNKEFGYIARKVPAHMPHMVNRDVIEEMQNTFRPYFDATSSHKVRHPEDMQFAFSFNYYIIGKQVKANLSDIFDKVDTDNTGWLSEREQRNLAAVLYPLPLTMRRIKEMEDHMKNCSRRLNKFSSPDDAQEAPPLVTKLLFINCHELWRSLNVTAERKKFQHELEGENDVIFKMIRNNATYVLHQLDRIRKNRKKFICLNDDLDHAKVSTKTIRVIMKDFYESFFPVPSQFELSPKFRNKFTYKRELDKWLIRNKKRNENINFLIIFFIILLVFCIFRRKVLQNLKRLFRVFRARERGAFNVPRQGEENFMAVFVKPDNNTFL